MIEHKRQVLDKLFTELDAMTQKDYLWGWIEYWHDPSAPVWMLTIWRIQFIWDGQFRVAWEPQSNWDLRRKGE